MLWFIEYAGIEVSCGFGRSDFGPVGGVLGYGSGGERLLTRHQVSSNRLHSQRSSKLPASSSRLLFIMFFSG